MPEFSRTIIDIARHVMHKRAAPDQGGLLTGQDPTAINLSDPLRLWIIQLGVIIFTTQVLSLILRKLRQPRVIAEVIGGILLGPTVFGRIPGFTQHIFPTDSRPYLNLVANIGLCLFLFIVGLEIDASVIKRNARLSLTIAAFGVCIPFGIGTALSVPLYHHFIDSSVSFTNFMLFTAVTLSITAFPVLCRILTELKLLDTTVGIVVLSAGSGIDIIGWTLLALTVALVNSGSGLNALWVLLVCVGWALFLIFIVRHALFWLARRTGSTRDGPTMFFMTVVMILLFGSSFFTDVIGVHAIFGAFLVGIIVPREGGLAISLTEKLEDMVSIIFLPLYFTLSGLSTDLSLLNNGVTWGFTILICTLDYTGKFSACTTAARISGFSWRESCTIGSFMSCKGLVDLIVLNVGLSAGILSPRVFAMFVLDALLLTFMTTPAVTVLYPPSMRKRVAVGWTGDDAQNSSRSQDVEAAQHSGGVTQGLGDKSTRHSRFTVVLDRLEHMPGMLAFAQLIFPSPSPSPSSDDNSSEVSSQVSEKAPLAPSVTVDAVRLIELSDRTSAVMKSSNAESLLHTDPLLSIFTAFGALHGIRVNTSLSIVTFDDLGSSVAEHAKNNGSQLVLVPWLPPHYSVDRAPSPGSNDPGATGDNVDVTSTPRTPHVPSPFEALFRSTNLNSHSADTSVLHAQFIRNLFASSSKTDVALFIDRHAPGEMPLHAGAYRLFVPFFGGPDDRLALQFAVQLCANSKIRATVVRMTKRDHTLSPSSSIDKAQEITDGAPGDHSAMFPDTVYGNASTQTRMQSETADNIAWARYAHPEAADPSLAPALSRMTFSEVTMAEPLHHIVKEALAMSRTENEKSRLLVLTGRSRRLAVEDHSAELKSVMEEYGGIANEVKRTIGDVAASLVVSGCQASIVVFQAAVAGAE
ncbi:Sodium/hydrogen exchanger family-domain-containing protein [Cubamyces lactineus]|nr:Sodium/hydrogen exchanger family-domain-containing protein [Cubamyces lactineus]